MHRHERAGPWVSTEEENRKFYIENANTSSAMAGIGYKLSEESRAASASSTISV